MRLHWKVCAIAAALASATAAKADMQLSERGAVAHLNSTRLQPDDAQAFAEFLDRPRAQPIRIVYLDSLGGNTRVAMQIGRLIRERGIDTAFHVGHGRCVSACTTIFLGGRNRYYIGSENVADGPATRLGLGFHPTEVPLGEERINEYYEQMGVPGAARMRYRIYPREEVHEGMGRRKLYFAGGRSALETGIATSTDEPPDPALRD